jgi:RNA polymerase sigma-70 factor (ECF subfamily)
MDGTAASLTMSGQAWRIVRPKRHEARNAQPERHSPVYPDATRIGSMRDADDPSLVRACLAGDKRAFDILVERHRRQVYQVCYRFAGNHEDAAELTQDVFLRAYRALGTFKGRSALGTWLYRIAVNVGLNRAAIRQPPVETIDRREHADTCGELPDAGLLRSERAAKLRRAVARLPKTQRTTLILRVYHELPHEQIAAILGSSAGAVKTNFFHALTKLRKLLQEDQP